MAHHLSASEIELFAVNAYSLYEAHKSLARAGASLTVWTQHVRRDVMQAWRREISGRFYVAPCEITATAEALRSYYIEHVAECDA